MLTFNKVASGIGGLVTSSLAFLSAGLATVFYANKSVFCDTGGAQASEWASRMFSAFPKIAKEVPGFSGEKFISGLCYYSDSGTKIAAIASAVLATASFFLISNSLKTSSSKDFPAGVGKDASNSLNLLKLSSTTSIGSGHESQNKLPLKGPATTKLLTSVPISTLKA
jgi:hypothetical protein